jgi:hypothetical protein
MNQLRWPKRPRTFPSSAGDHLECLTRCDDCLGYGFPGGTLPTTEYTEDTEKMETG